MCGPGKGSGPVAVFVLLQHGSEGRRSNLHNFAGRLDKAASDRGVRLTWWDTDVNHLLRTNLGVVSNGAALAGQLLPRLHQWLEETPDARAHVVSVVGHSYGGVLVREAAFLVHQDAVLRGQITFGTFCAVSAPLCGARDLNPVHYYGALALGKVGASRNYLDLLLADDSNEGGALCTWLVNEPHLDALAAFHRRLLVPNTRADPLVKFATSSLVYEDRESHGLGDAAPLATEHTFPFVEIGGVADLHHPPFAAGPEERDKQIALTLRQAMPWTIMAVRGGAWGVPNAHSSVIGKLSWLHQPLWDVLDRIAGTIVEDAVAAAESAPALL